jgi:uncharacterized membrane protein
MTTVFFLGLSAAALYVAKRWRDSNAENVELRNQVASLKRQLRRFMRPG